MPGHLKSLDALLGRHTAPKPNFSIAAANSAETDWAVQAPKRPRSGFDSDGEASTAAVFVGSVDFVGVFEVAYPTARPVGSL